LKLKLPELSAWVVALAVPLSVTVAPFPVDAGLMEPKMPNVEEPVATTTVVFELFELEVEVEFEVDNAAQPTRVRPHRHSAIPAMTLLAREVFFSTYTSRSRRSAGAGISSDPVR
jgi:hypothetical protein